MKLPSLYIVFDVLPKKKEGGLVASYSNFVRLFSEFADIHLVSVFQFGENDIPEFDTLPKHVLVDRAIDNRFYKAFSYLRRGSFSKFLYAIKSALLFFVYMPVTKKKGYKLFQDKAVIATSPAAAAFLSSKLKYLLEIHTQYEYFWGKNIIGRLQSTIIPSPTCTIFRSKTDAKKGSTKFFSDYIYNCFDDSEIQPVVFSYEQRYGKVLFLGRLVEEKNPLMLLDCAQRVYDKIKDFKLDIYGSGPMEGYIQQEIDSRGLSNVVTLRGFTDNKAVYSRYALLWITSEYEGLPLNLVEAKANMVPAISTPWGEAVNEVISQGMDGYIAKTPDKFAEYTIKAMNDKEELSRLSSNARASYEANFTPEVYLHKWLSIADREFL